jgi:hypothetical protein
MLFNFKWFVSHSGFYFLSDEIAKHKNYSHGHVTIPRKLPRSNDNSLRGRWNGIDIRDFGLKVIKSR